MFRPRPTQSHHQLKKKKKKKLANETRDTYGEHERGIEDGRVGAEEASVFSAGEPFVRRPIKLFHRQIVHSPLPLLCFSCPAISPEHAHRSVSVCLLSPDLCLHIRMNWNSPSYTRHAVLSNKPFSPWNPTTRPFFLTIINIFGKLSHEGLLGPLYNDINLYIYICIRFRFSVFRFFSFSSGPVFCFFFFF
jgi:hypothetical protein